MRLLNQLFSDGSFPCLGFVVACMEMRFEAIRRIVTAVGFGYLKIGIMVRRLCRYNVYRPAFHVMSFPPGA